MSARIRNLCIIAERELTFRKRPSQKPQHLVTMSHKLLTFHYLFLPSLINLSLLTRDFCKYQKTLGKVIVNFRKYRKTLGKVRVYASRCQQSTAQHSAAQQSTAQRSAANTAQHSAAQHSTAQHSAAQHSTAQHISAQHSSAQHRISILCMILGTRATCYHTLFKRLIS